MTRHIISVRVENKFGVLARVAGLFSARGYNIDSLAVSSTEHEGISVMTIVVKGDNRILEQVKKHVITSYSIHYTKLYDFSDIFGKSQISASLNCNSV